MTSPPLPVNEAERLAALRKLDVLDTPAEDRFDRLTRVAKTLFEVPIARIALVDAQREWFKSLQGMIDREVPREYSFAAHAILDDAVLWVGDTAKDARFSDNPLVTIAPRVRFYAGYPIRTTTGQCVGTLCIMDSVPRAFSPLEQNLLADLGRVVARELEASPIGTLCPEFLNTSAEQRKPWLDGVTGVWNREGMMEIMRKSLANCADKNLTATLLLVEVDISAKARERWTETGHDLIVAEIAQILRSAIPSQDTIGRTRNEQFTVLLRGLPVQVADQRVAEIRKRLDENPMLASIGVPLHLGHTCVTPRTATNDLEATLEVARGALARARRVTPSPKLR
jgi:diguanylate cyclase (GGDEF)-like protein